MRWAAGRPRCTSCPSGTAATRSRCHHAEPVPSSDEEILPCSGRHPVSPHARGLQGLGKRAGRRASPSANAYAKRFPAACARAYNSHHAPPGPHSSPEGGRSPGRRAHTSFNRLPCGVFGSSSIQSGRGRWLTRYDLGGSVTSGPEEPPVARGTPRA